MRKIEEQILEAINAKKDFQQSNTEVKFSKLVPGKFEVYLFSNLIAKGDIHTREVKVSNCGFYTLTTKSRINALLANESIYQKQDVWYLRSNNKEFINFEDTFKLAL